MVIMSQSGTFWGACQYLS